MMTCSAVGARNGANFSDAAEKMLDGAENSALKYMAPCNFTTFSTSDNASIYILFRFSNARQMFPDYGANRCRPKPHQARMPDDETSTAALDDRYCVMDTEFALLVESILTTQQMASETEGLKNKLKETWNSGDYDYFSRYMERDARAFYERIHVPAGAKLLDVGCGSGQLALWAARDGAKVVGVDIAPRLVQRAQARANAEDLPA